MATKKTGRTKKELVGKTVEFLDKMLRPHRTRIEAYDKPFFITSDGYYWNEDTISAIREIPSESE